MDQQNQPPISYFYNGEWKEANCGQCIHPYLGDYIDIEWNMKEGKMKLSSSVDPNKFGYQKDENNQIEFIRGAEFCHGKRCSDLFANNVPNPAKPMKPCTCVMLFNEKEESFLITQRDSKLRTFPGAWVLPGGHLEKDEGIFEGGLRECQEEVGLPLEESIPLSEKRLMVWESVFADSGNIKACAIVLFFIAKCETFNVKIQPLEVSQFLWKKLNDKTEELPYNVEKQTGYAEGHLKFLSIVRSEFGKQI